jgi:hypothetical protein
MASTTSSSRHNNLQLALEEAYRCVPVLRYALFIAFICDPECVYMCLQVSYRPCEAVASYDGRTRRLQPQHLRFGCL